MVIYYTINPAKIQGSLRKFTFFSNYFPLQNSRPMLSDGVQKAGSYLWLGFCFCFARWWIFALFRFGGADFSDDMACRVDARAYIRRRHFQGL